MWLFLEIARWNFAKLEGMELEMPLLVWSGETARQEWLLPKDEVSCCFN
jgi:hypothetical protein